MTNIDRQLGQAQQWTAFWIGVYWGGRTHWMKRARQYKAMGAANDLIAHCVQYAREDNRYLVQMARHLPA